MHVRRFLTGAALTASAVLALATQAAAAPAPAFEADVIGVVTVDRSDPTVGTVTARYRCTGEVFNTWVSVKQSADRTADPLLTEESSSEYAAAWSQSHPTSATTCDGRWHVGRFTVDHTEAAGPGVTLGKGELRKGEGYVQFCLYTSEGFIVQNEFLHVR